MWLKKIIQKDVFSVTVEKATTTRVLNANVKVNIWKKMVGATQKINSVGKA